ncbi:MAG: hypothetical protein GX675_01325 [Erysipelotrichaceae bacterium]|nr:hypothetical protein [Erysipelotrichaceae bacterium]
MIIVNAPLRGDEIQQAVSEMEGKNIEFVKKEGMKYYFKSDNEEQDAVEIKALLKKHPRFSTIYTAVQYVK